MADPTNQAPPSGDKPDLGQKSEALSQSLSGTDSGSDTRAGSLQGGAATGSDDDPDADVVNKAMADEGRRRGEPKA